ncbi:MAG: hypothetical protein ACFB15_31220 [Cyclobacteriaceae bacterium]
MIITKELLRRFHEGLCSEEERTAVEKWLRSTDDIPSVIDINYRREYEESKEAIWEKITEMGPDLASSSSESKRGKVVSLYQRISRYAAVACLIIGICIGYFASPPSAQADTVKKPKHLTDLLYIYGGNGAYTKMNATRYRVKFEGRLKLYNDADQPKQLVCGEQEFTLEPHRAYFLSGSNQNALLTKDQGQPYSLEGDFSILELDD